MHSNLVKIKALRPPSKQSTRMIEYNSNSDSGFDNSIEFINVNLPYNNVSIQLLANDSITHTKKKRVVRTKDEVDEASKIKTTKDKKMSVK